MSSSKCFELRAKMARFVLQDKSIWHSKRASLIANAWNKCRSVVGNIFLIFFIWRQPFQNPLFKNAFNQSRNRCLPLSLFHPASATRLGDIWKFLAANFNAKVAPMFKKLFGLFENITFKNKNCSYYFLGNFWGNWPTFYSPVCSHCSPTNSVLSLTRLPDI